MSLLAQVDPAAYIEGPLSDIADLGANIDPETERLTPAQASQVLRAMEEYLEAGKKWLQEKGVIFFGLLGMEMLLTPALMVPVYAALLWALRGQPVSIPAALGQLRLAPRAILLALWTMLRVYAWMLPGYALMIAALFVSEGLVAPLLIAGVIAALVLGLRALLHYILAPVVMVDQPTLSLNGCIRVSWQEMRHRKMEYFLLRVSFVGWMLLVSLLTSFALGLLGNVLGLAVSMLAELVLSVYINGAVVAFYDAYVVKREHEGGARPAADMPETPEELN